MKFCEALDVRPGVTAVIDIGSGGKSSLLRRLAEEVPGTVILCTTTHIRPFSEYPVLENPSPADIRQALAAGRVLCTGTPCENGKLTAPALPMEVLAELADFVLAEADGSRQLPLKAHAAHEPVIPENSRRVICVVGASGFGKPVRETVHRWERFCGLTGAAETNHIKSEAARRLRLHRIAESTVTMQNADVSIALDLSVEWENTTGEKLPMGVIIGRTEYVKENPEAVNAFLDQYAASAEYVNANPADAAVLSEKFGLIKAAVAEKAIPYCNIVCLEGDEMKTALTGFYQVLFDFNPQTIGGTIPSEDFFYAR